MGLRCPRIFFQKSFFIFLLSFLGFCEIYRLLVVSLKLEERNSGSDVRSETVTTAKVQIKQPENVEHAEKQITESVKKKKSKKYVRHKILLLAYARYILCKYKHKYKQLPFYFFYATASRIYT